MSGAGVALFLSGVGAAFFARTSGARAGTAQKSGGSATLIVREKYLLYLLRIFAESNGTIEKLNLESNNVTPATLTKLFDAINVQVSFFLSYQLPVAVSKTLLIKIDVDILRMNKLP